MFNRIFERFAQLNQYVNTRRTVKRRNRTGTLKRTQIQEMARRVRQITRGQLTSSNGLWSRDWHVDSHGIAQRNT